MHFIYLKKKRKFWWSISKTIGLTFSTFTKVQNLVHGKHQIGLSIVYSVWSHEYWVLQRIARFSVKTMADLGRNEAKMRGIILTSWPLGQVTWGPDYTSSCILIGQIIARDRFYCFWLVWCTWALELVNWTGGGGILPRKCKTMTSAECNRICCAPYYQFRLIMRNHL